MLANTKYLPLENLHPVWLVLASLLAEITGLTGRIKGPPGPHNSCAELEVAAVPCGGSFLSVFLLAQRARDADLTLFLQDMLRSPSPVDPTVLLELWAPGHMVA